MWELSRELYKRSINVALLIEGKTRMEEGKGKQENITRIRGKKTNKKERPKEKRQEKEK